MNTFLADKNVSYELDMSLKNKDFAHAYLFLGEVGIGKFTQAKNFARSILCSDVTNSQSFCNLGTDFTHPDLIIVREEGTIKKEIIEDLIEKSKIRPYESNFKIIIIDNFENTTIEGQNALLKTLEEPEDFLKIFLVSSNKSKILPTILSRCRILKYKSISTDRIERFLIDKNVSEKNAKLFSRLSHGNVNLSLRYIEDSNLLEKRNVLVEVIDSITRTGGYSVFSNLEYFRENKEDIDKILNFMLIWFRDLAFIRLNRDKDIINIDKINILKLCDFSLEKIMKLYNKIIKAKKHLEKNINYDLVVQDLLIEIGGI